jgi:NAD(P)-dependent dehydrogenase (short-subunit alcohol dehydrogenase family)
VKAFPPVRAKSVMVTGASSGIGRATARVLQAAGWRVFPTARRREDLDALRAEGFQPVELDLADEDSVEQAAKEVLELSQGVLGALVNNAGYGLPGALEDLSRAALRKQFETNVFGTLDLTAQLVPVFRAQGWGRIVLLSSVVGRVTIPLLGAYSASKAAIEAAGDALRMELGGAGIGVSLVEPGPIDTHFRARCVGEGGRALDMAHSAFSGQYERELGSEERTFKRPTDVFRKPPEAVAAKIRHALESRHPHARYPVTGAAWLGVLADSFLPARVQDWLLRSKVIRRAPSPPPRGGDAAAE